MNNCFKGGSCPKSGIKIHETVSNRNTMYNPNEFSNDNTNFQQRNNINNVDLYNTSLNELDLNVENYSLNDLLNLFNIPNNDLNEVTMKQAKQIVLKMHPDKSRLDTKYFLFFSKAYKQLTSIYEFQNKNTTKKVYKDEDFYDESNRHLLDNMFKQNSTLKDGPNFNKWFNESFEKHRIDNPHEHGYGDWLKSNDDFLGVGENVTKSNMNEIFEQKKKQVQALMPYTGVVDSFSSGFGCSLSDDSDGGFGSTSNYTDLRQAYTETLIPVTLEDYDKMPKYKNFNDYKKQRDNLDTNPLDKAKAEKILYEREQKENNASAALAYKYAREAEKAREANNSFWGDIKRLTGF